MLNKWKIILKKVKTISFFRRNMYDAKGKR